MRKTALRWLVTCSVLAGFTTVVSAQSRLIVGSGEGAELGDIVDLPLSAESDSSVQAVFMTFEWDDRKGEGIDLVLGPALEGADMVQTRVEGNYMVLTAIIDMDGAGPLELPAGTSDLGTAQVRCICEGNRQEVAVALPHKSTRAIEAGGAVIENGVAVAGSILRIQDGVGLENGLLVCNGEGGGGPEEPEVSCGAVDENGDLVPATGVAGGDVTLCYFYRSPVTEDPTERIQGLQISSSFDCRLTCAEDTLSTAGTVLEELEAEFVMVNCDNDSEDGDGCELIAGILLDAGVPVDGRTLPGTEDYRSLFCLDFSIAEDVETGALLEIDFVNGLNGRGIVPIQNLVSINNFDAPLNGTACAVEVVDENGGGDDADFLRGDCNYNEAVNVADAAAIVSHLFLEDALSFDPPCLDACDSDDSGDLAITDTIFLLRWLFIPGEPVPPAPGPTTAGPDPTEDELTCRPDLP